MPYHGANIKKNHRKNKLNCIGNQTNKDADRKRDGQGKESVKYDNINK